jgi:thymidylate synthase ThyX
MEGEFLAGISRTEKVYRRFRQAAPEAADYILTTAHRRRISLKINARELYHIARIRTDRHAQWDIREIARQMTDLGKKAMPLTLMLATGKDDFPSRYEEVFAHPLPCP